MKTRLSTYPLRLPVSLKAAVAEVSRADGISINQFVTTAVAEKLSAMKTAEFFADRKARADIEAARRLLRRDGGQPPTAEDRMPQARIPSDGAPRGPSPSRAVPTRGEASLGERPQPASSR